MPRLRRLSSSQVIAILAGFGFAVFSQRGSHIKLRRITADGNNQTLIVARRRQIPVGTLYDLYRQACRYIPEENLRPHFYTD